MSKSMGQIIRSLRKERGLTQEELAEQLNITYQAVSRWENNTGMPDISQIVPLANVFGVSTDVLFGKEDTDCQKEIDECMAKAEDRLCNPPENLNVLENRRECCEDVLAVLKIYPNNYELLAYSIGNICCLVDQYYWDPDAESKKAERQFWENECIRQANVILAHCTDSRYLNAANKWMTVLYRRMQNFEKAEEHARKIDVFNQYEEGGAWLADVYDCLGKKEQSRKQYGNNINKALDYLHHQLAMLGYSWRSDAKYEQAYSCFKLYCDFYDCMMGEVQEELPFCLNVNYEDCAEMCMRLGRYDEAMEWLEKMIAHQRFVVKNYNVVTKSSLPFLPDLEFRYTANVYDRTNLLLPTLSWKLFDPIRDTERFKVLFAAAQAFEKGE